MPFQKGVSGNPGGRPKRKLVTDALVKELAARGPGKFTHAQEFAWKMVQLAIAGDVPAARLVLEYSEGKPAQPVTGADSAGPVEFTIMIAGQHGDSDAEPE